MTAKKIEIAIVVPLNLLNIDVFPSWVLLTICSYSLKRSPFVSPKASFPLLLYPSYPCVASGSRICADALGSLNGKSPSEKATVITWQILIE